MKISTFFIFLLVVSGVFFVFAEIIRESNQQFPDSNINSSEWEDKYEYVEEINDTLTPLADKLKIIQDDESGWFSKLTAGITAIPYAVMLVPQALFGGMEFGGGIMLSIFIVLLIPPMLITIATIILLVWGLFELIKFFNKTDV